MDYRSQSMNKVGAVFLLSVVFSGVASAQTEHAKPQYAKPYDTAVAHFESHRETALQALLRLGIESKVAFGIVRVSGDQLCENVADVVVDNQSVLYTVN